MNKHILFAAVAATLFAAPVHAIKINDQALTTNGGSMSDIQGTAPNVFDTLRTSSNAAQFDAVGRIGDCTGTWLGSEGEYAWVLTAARCVRNTNLVGAADHLTFTRKDGVALAGGAGSTSYIHPKRINRPSSVRDAGTDIALVRLKRLPASDGNGAPQQPVIYNAKAEAGAPVGFVAYGSAFVNNTNVNAVWPTTGERRAWGESKLDGVTENGHALFANYTTGSTTNWAGLTTSDAGSAWWQERDGQWQIIATTSSGNTVQSLGARASTYASWINDLFPPARLSSERDIAGADSAPELTEARQFIGPSEGQYVGYLVSPDQPGVEGPRIFQGGGDVGHSVLKVPVVNAGTGENRTITIRANRLIYCGNHRLRMNDPTTTCGGNHLEMSFVPSDNHQLGNGTWRGRVSIDAVKNHGGGLVAQYAIDIDATVSRSVTATQGVVTDNLGAGIAFTIPTQSTASGPTSRHSVSATTGISTITVQARDAVTQTIVPIKLRAHRNNGCNDIAMNNTATCGQATSILKVSFDPTDNPALPAGRYGATFNVQAAVMGNTGFNITLPIDLDLNLLP